MVAGSMHGASGSNPMVDGHRCAADYSRTWMHPHFEEYMSTRSMESWWSAYCRHEYNEDLFSIIFGHQQEPLDEHGEKALYWDEALERLQDLVPGFDARYIDCDGYEPGLRRAPYRFDLPDENSMDFQFCFNYLWNWASVEALALALIDTMVDYCVNTDGSTTGMALFFSGADPQDLEDIWCE